MLGVEQPAVYRAVFFLGPICIQHCMVPWFARFAFFLGSFHLVPKSIVARVSASICASSLSIPSQPGVMARVGVDSSMYGVYETRRVWVSLESCVQQCCFLGISFKTVGGKVQTLLNWQKESDQCPIGWATARCSWWRAIYFTIPAMVWCPVGLDGMVFTVN